MNSPSYLYRFVLFNLVQELERNNCFQCGTLIETLEEFSIEHKVPWRDDPENLYLDYNNIAFSHLSCNCRARRSPERLNISEEGRVKRAETGAKNLQQLLVKRHESGYFESEVHKNQSSLAGKVTNDDSHRADPKYREDRQKAARSRKAYIKKHTSC